MLLGAVILQISTWTLIVERFDPRSNTWNKLPSMHSRRASASGAAIKKKVFVFGGTQPEGVDGHACWCLYDKITYFMLFCLCSVLPYYPRRAT